MAIAIALPGFNDLGRSVTPIFLLMDHFLYRFSTISEKMKKIYRLEVWISCKMHNRIPLFSALRLSLRRFKMASWTVQFCVNVDNIKNHLRNRPSFCKIGTKTVCLRWLTFDISNYKPLYTELRVPIFQIRAVFLTLYLSNEVGDPQLMKASCCVLDLTRSSSTLHAPEQKLKFKK